MRRAAIASLLGLGMMMSAAAPAAAQPMAPKPGGAADTACNTATPPVFNGLAKDATSGSVMPISRILPAGVATDITYLQPTGQGLKHPQFRVVLTPDGGEPVAVLSVSHPPAAQDGDARSVADNQDAYGVRAMLPNLNGWFLFRDERLTVFACDQPTAADGAGGASSVVSVASLPVLISNRTAAIWLSLLIMAAVYAVAARLRWLASCSTRDVNHKLRERLAQAGHVRARLSRARPELTWQECLNPVVLSADIFNRASLSQLQVLIFLLLTGFGVAYSLLRTGTLSDLSSSIVYLLGIPALGALGSQTVSSTKDRFSTDNWTWLVSRHVLAVDDPGTSKAKARDLLMTGTQVDLYKLQALTFSIIVGAAMILSIFSGVNNLETFKVPDTLLQILGLSQAVFVGGRFAAPASVGDADSLVTELRQRACNLRVAAATGIDINCTGQPLRTVDPSAPPPPLNTVHSLADAYKIVPVAVAHYEEIASEVEIILKGLTYRDVATEELKEPFAWDRPRSAVGDGNDAALQ